MITRLKCLLLDDELPALSYLKLLCEQTPGVEVVRAFNDPLKFLEAVPLLDFDLCILDIQMPGLNGLDTAKQLKNKLVIFTTAHKEFAAEAFDLNAVDYVRKPLQKERFEQALAKALARLESGVITGSSQHVWSTDKGKMPIVFADILYIAASGTDSRDKLVYLADGRRATIKNTGFEQILAVLPQAAFCRINKKEIIALKQVAHYSADRIVTGPRIREREADGFYLSEVYREDFERKMKAR